MNSSVESARHGGPRTADGPLPNRQPRIEATLRKAIKVARKRMTWDEILHVVAGCSAEDPEPVSSFTKKKPAQP